MNDSHVPRDPDDVLDAEAEELRRLAAALPREVTPPRDLWPGIAARLRPRTPRRVGVLRPAPAWGLGLLAATLLMAVGGVLTHVFVSPRLAAPPPAGDVAAAGLGRDVRRVASAEAPVAARARWSVELAAAETDVMRAKESLWRSALAGQDGLQRETAAVVARNLTIIDAAISEVRAALDADPGNPQLAQLLLESHRKEIALLERLSRPTLEV